MIKKIVTKVAGNTVSDAAPCFACDGYYQYRCYNNMRQRRWVNVYGCRCERRSYSNWTYTGCCGYPCPTP